MSKKLTPSKYQQDILDEITNSWDRQNLFISAVAGAGKTSTLKMIAEVLTGNTMFVAFNKHIAEELKDKLPETTRIATINSTGLQMIYATQKKNDIPLKHESWKMVKIINNVMSELFRKKPIFKTRYSEEDLMDIKDALKELCDMVRVTYCDYENTDEWINSIIEKYEIFDSCKPILFDVCEVVRECIEQDIELYNKERIVDFNDQIFLPVKLNMIPPHYFQRLDTVLIDEAQDLNRCSTYLLKKLGNKDTRFIAVGDISQAIYSFAGSDSNSIPNIIKNYNCVEFPLSTCYRCPSSHIELAQQIVPTIESKPNAPIGEVNYICNEDIATLVEVGDMVLARKNKELSKIMIDILKLGKPIYIKDTELISKMESLIKKQKCTTVVALKNKLKKYEKTIEEKTKEAKAKGEENTEIEFANNTFDLYETTQILLDWYIKTKGETHTKEEFVLFLTQSFKSGKPQDSVIISSVHCAKGAEADNVFLINSHLFPYYNLARGLGEKIKEEKNILYVALTRAKNKLYLCSDDLSKRINLKNIHNKPKTNKLELEKTENKNINLSLKEMHILTDDKENKIDSDWI